MEGSLFLQVSESKWRKVNACFASSTTTSDSKATQKTLLLRSSKEGDETTILETPLSEHCAIIELEKPFSFSVHDADGNQIAALQASDDRAKEEWLDFFSSLNIPVRRKTERRHHHHHHNEEKEAQQAENEGGKEHEQESERAETSPQPKEHKHKKHTHKEQEPELEPEPELAHEHEPEHELERNSDQEELAPAAPSTTKKDKGKESGIAAEYSATSLRSNESGDSDSPAKIRGRAQSVLRRSMRFDDYEPVVLGEGAKEFHKQNPDQPIPPSAKKKKRLSGRHRPLFHFKCNVMGEVIYKKHPSWVLMTNIQIGILHFTSQDSLSDKQREMLSDPKFVRRPSFYDTPTILRFPSEGSDVTVPHATPPFKFKDYCPLAFRYLRALFDVNRLDYMASLCESSLRLMGTPGKSGSLFFFSHDMKYVMKTIPKDEAKLLRELLPPYVRHVSRYPDTLLPKFYGLYRVKPHLGRQVRFIVMNNLFATDKKIHERYDLKGSTVGRYLSKGELEVMGRNATLKDLNFTEMGKSIRLGPEKTHLFLHQLKRDVRLMKKLGTMDYSLLVGIHSEEIADLEAKARVDSDSGEPEPPLPGPAFVEAAPGDFLTMDVDLQQPLVKESPSKIPKFETIEPLDNPPLRATSLFNSDNGGMRGLDAEGKPTGEFYFIGIIDILMLYTFRKAVEHTYKTLRFRGKGQISSVDPAEYADRFLQFISSVTK